MAITSYSTLKTSLADWLARSDLATVLDDFINFGENRIYRDLRIKAMETALSASIASDGTLAVPSGYIEMKHMYIDGSPTQPVERRKAEWIYQTYPDRSSNSKPHFFAREADNFIFGPFPDSTYTVKGLYYKKLDPLSTSNETNWFTTNAPSLLLYAALAETEPYLGDDGRIAIWEAMYQKVRKQVQDDSNVENTSGSILAARAI